MTTKIRKGFELPAGILSGFEIFVHQYQVFAMNEGNLLTYEQFPSSVKLSLNRAFTADRKIVTQLWPSLGPTKAFVKWVECRFGPLDATPDVDLQTGELTPDDCSYCSSTTCAGAGVLCKIPFNLKPYEVITVSLSNQGLSNKKIGAKVNRSDETIKSQLEKVRYKVGANGKTHLASLTSNLLAR